MASSLDPKRFPPISDQPLKIALGTFLILFTLLGLMSQALLSGVIAIVSAFFVGELRILGFLLLISYGISLILNRPFIRIKFRLSTFGVILLILAVLGLSTFEVYRLNPSLPPLTLWNVGTQFFDQFPPLFEYPPAFDNYAIGGGILGYLVLALLNTLAIGPLNQIVLLSFLILGMFLSLEKLWSRLIHHLSLTIDQRQKEREYFKHLSDNKPIKSPETTYTEVDEESGQPIIYRSLFPHQSVSGLKKVGFQKPSLQATQKSPIVGEPSNALEPVSLSPKTTETNDSLYTPPEPLGEAPIVSSPRANPPSERVPVTSVPMYTTYEKPSLDLLDARSSVHDQDFNEAITKQRVSVLEQKFVAMNVQARVVGYEIGPSVTSFDIQMQEGAPTSQVKKVLLDLGVALGGYEISFRDIVPGKTVSSLEVVNERSAMVGYKEMLIDLRQQPTSSKFMIPFGRNITGEVVAFTPKDMIHLLVAGSSGSGKTVFMHTFIMTILMQASPADVKMILIDPKKFELSKYKNLPHLLCPIISEMDEAKVALERLVVVMEERYQALQDSETSSLEQYNRYAAEHNMRPFPLIFAIIDEYNDLINTHPQVSDLVTRLAQKARAAGIHLLIATQRPTTDIITGSIKNNMATIVALRVAKQVDSVTVLGHSGAEILGGNGDMYLVNPLFSRMGEVRVQGAFVSDEEIYRICADIRNRHLPDYDEAFLNLNESKEPSNSSQGTPVWMGGQPELSDPMYEHVKEAVMHQQFVSMNWIARTFEMGYPRALRLFKMLQNDGVIDPVDTNPQNNKGRKVLKRIGDPLVNE